MEELKTMKECLTSQVQAQMSHLDTVDAHELGEAVDMIKDLAEAIYYCTVTEAMEKSSEDKEKMNTNNNTYYYSTTHYDRPMEYSNGKMYYGEGNSSSSGMGPGNNSGNSSNSSSNGTSYYHEEYWPQEFRDYREGRSPMQRKMYMESKDLHKGSEIEMKELESYLQDLSADITEMVRKASPEEKQILQKKISGIAAKINV